MSCWAVLMIIPLLVQTADMACQPVEQGGGGGYVAHITGPGSGIGGSGGRQKWLSR